MKKTMKTKSESFWQMPVSPARAASVALTGLLVLFSIFAIGCRASLERMAHRETEKRPVSQDSRYFAYPDSELVMESGHDRWAAKLTEAPVRHQNKSERPEFRNSIDFYGKIRVGYEFAGKTEFGDVYVVFIEEAQKQRELVPNVFEGKDKMVVERKGLKIQIRKIRA